MVLPSDSSITPRTYPKDPLPDDFGTAEPFVLFRQWFESAIEKHVVEPDAATLSTFDGKRVNARTVALRGISENELLFYTNYHSTKAREIECNHEVSITFYWREVFRQIRLRGTMTMVSTEQSDAYFASRPHGSQVAAWVSRQSEEVSSRAEIDETFETYSAQFQEDVPRPPFWGGFSFIPDEYEFMQGHENRLHDRFLFTLTPQGKYTSQRLWP